jgi:clan AA aspartic protease (TIGR02281 family)
MELCQIPSSGPLTQPEPQSRNCVSQAYRKMREAWLARLSGPAHEEAVRPLRTHIALQGALQELGFMPASPIDGVYGAATRTAIAAWQNAHGFAVTGFLGDAEAQAIEQEVESRQAAIAPEGQGAGISTQDAFAPATSPAARTTDASEAPYFGPAVRIPMEKTGDVYTVPVRINGQITLRFTVDSGASDVQLPADVALTMVRTGTLSPSDFVGSETYTLANGAELKSARFIIHELRIGDYTVTNVPASIGSIKSDLLLGQSFLSRFASWTVDNNRHALVLGEPSR